MSNGIWEQKRGQTSNCHIEATASQIEGGQQQRPRWPHQFVSVIISERTNRTRTGSSSIEPGSSMKFDGSIELESSIHRTKIEPDPYLNEPFSTNIQQTKRKIVKN